MQYQLKPNPLQVSVLVFQAFIIYHRASKSILQLLSCFNLMRPMTLYSIKQSLLIKSWTK